MLVRSAGVTDDDYPLIGYDQIVTTINIVADTEEDGYPATRLANPSTHLYWMAQDTTTQYITITTDGVTTLNYLAVIGHNLGTYGIQASVEKFLSGAWVTIGDATTPDDDGVLMWHMEDTVASAVRLKLFSGGSVPAQIAVLLAGQVLKMETQIYPGHMPLSHAFDTDVVNGFSQNGKFLGRVIYGETRVSKASFIQVTPEWFRANMIGFMEASQERPFVFVWRPATYPEELSYAVLLDDIQPANADDSNNNLIAFDLNMEAVAP